MTNPLPSPEERKKARPELLNAETPPPGQTAVHDWRSELGTHWAWWMHRRRLQWKQALAAVLVTLGSLLLWLALVEALD